MRSILAEMRRNENRKSGSRVIEFSVIAGDLKGRKITAPDLGITRPPLTRLRKSIFDFLKPYLDGARYLDLFSGTGSYLFEAVSRGASKAVGVELNRDLVASINDQAVKFEIGERLSCVEADVLKILPVIEAGETAFDIVMIAPPQYRSLIHKTIATLLSTNLISSETLVLCQHDSSETEKIDWIKFEVVQQRKYGNTTFTILKLPS